MGYDTWCSGVFEFRDPTKQREILLDLDKMFIEQVKVLDNGNVFINTGSIHMYNAEDLIHMIAKHLNGKLTCNGEEQEDFYDLIFKDGEIDIVQYMLVPKKPRKLNEEEDFGWKQYAA